MIDATRSALAAMILLAATGAATAQGTRGKGQGETWPFLPERDTFRADALLDLRSMNEKVAGQGGFIRLSDDKNSFVRGDGTPIRFWARDDLRPARPQPGGPRPPRPVPRQARRQPRAAARSSRVAREGTPSHRRRSQGDRRGLAARRGHEEGRDLHVDQSLLGDGAEAHPGVVGHRGLAGRPAAGRPLVLQPTSPGRLQGLAQGPARPRPTPIPASPWPRTPRWR